MPRIDVAGLGLHIQQQGSGPPVVLLHGFTGSSETWASLTELLAPHFEVVAVDIVGHGLSDSPEEVDRYRMERCVDDLVEVIAKLGHRRATWLGYSMGARAALSLAVRHPEVAEALVLEGVTAGLADPVLRAERIASDERLADRIERWGLESFIDFWQSIALWDTQATMPAARLAALRGQRLAGSPRGLANSLRGMGSGAQQPVHAKLAELSLPVLLLAGALDAKFTTIAAELAELLPRAEVASIPGTGHAAHFEDPQTFNRTVLGYLRKIHGRGSGEP